MDSQASDLAHRLAREAEAVCREYLSNGRREGGYWLVGDAANSPGRSLYFRLRGRESGKGAARKWTDAATGDHGDLLDIVRLSRNLSTVVEAMDEARLFLTLPTARAAQADPGAKSIARSVAPALCDGPTCSGHTRRRVSAGARCHRGPRRIAAPVSPVLLPPAAGRTA